MKTIGLALIALALALAGAWAYAEIAAADGELDSSGRRIDCIPRDHANPSGPCLWTPELTKVEVKVEFEYPYCEVKLDVESNLGELPAGVGIHNNNVGLVHVKSDGVARLLGGLGFVLYVGVPYSSNYDARHGDIWDEWFYTRRDMSAYVGIQGIYATRDMRSTYHQYRDLWLEMIAYYPDWKLKYDIPNYAGPHRPFRYKRVETDLFKTLTQAVLTYFPQTTFGTVEFVADLEYSGGFERPRRVGATMKALKEISPNTVRSNAIPLSHTFVGLVDEMFTCLEVAKREEARVAERVELEAQKAGLRQSLTLLESELARARRHELDATTILKEVIDVSARVDEMLRTIQRVRVEGLAERRKLIERYYSEESRRYSVFIRSLESSRAALAAADEAIAAHKAELERSRASLEALVSSAQAAEAQLIAEIEEAREALGDDGGD